MKIFYTTKKSFTKKQIQELFLSVHWISGQYPEQLYNALLNSQTVLTAWDKDKLVGLVRAIDDGKMLAFIHYVLVHPDYQRLGIASQMIKMIQQKYKSYLYIEVMPEESKNVSFYQKFGFQVMNDGIAMQIVNNNFGGE